MLTMGCSPAPTALQFTGISTQDFVRDSPWEKKKWELLPKSQYAAYAWGFFPVHNLPGACPDDLSCDWEGFTTIQVGGVQGRLILLHCSRHLSLETVSGIYRQHASACN
jgi:hypothetical protein